MKALLKLVRLSALPSAWADQLGGMALAYALASTLKYDWRPGTILTLALMSFGIYLGGMALNDVLHVRKDRLLQKKRPIVTGELSVGAAWAATLVLFALGLTGAFLSGCLVPAAVLVALIFLYNLLAAGRIDGVTVRHPKSWTVAGVVVIATCRAIHVCLPLYSHMGGQRLPDVFADKIVLLFAASVFVYFCMVTVVSLFEDSGGGRRALVAVIVLLAAPVLALPVYLLQLPGEAASPILGVFLPLATLAVLLITLWRRLDAARAEPTPPKLGACVGAGIRGECLLMAGFALMLAPDQPWWGFAAMALYPAGIVLSKWISPT
jgi:4-hydroxybenzoate polyprenyltransferase